MAAIENANKTANKLKDIGDVIKGLINSGKELKHEPKKEKWEDPENNVIQLADQANYKKNA